MATTRSSDREWGAEFDCKLGKPCGVTASPAALPKATASSPLATASDRTRAITLDASSGSAVSSSSLSGADERQFFDQADRAGGEVEIEPTNWRGFADEGCRCHRRQCRNADALQAAQIDG